MEPHVWVLGVLNIVAHEQEESVTYVFGSHMQTLLKPVSGQQELLELYTYLWREETLRKSCA